MGGVKDGITIFFMIYLIWGLFSPESFGEGVGEWYAKYHRGFTIGMTK